MMKDYLNRTPWLGYNAVWRWHFYAGLFCIPFIVLLAITGAIYLFKPQFEAYQDKAYAVLANGQFAQPVQAQVLAAAKQLPGAQFSAYQLPASPQSAAHIILMQQGNLYRVMVNPYNLAVLNTTLEEQRLMPWIHRLHGQLLIGDRGSNIVELAASWAIIMIVTGLFLWWPRDAKGMGGVLYPRLQIKADDVRGKTISQRIFWRDLHAVIGFWIAFFVLFLLISGLPWTKSWGGLLKEVCQWHAPAVLQIKQDWLTSQKEVLDAKTLILPNAAQSEHAQHDEHAQHNHAAQSSDQQSIVLPATLGAMVSHIAALQLSPPVIIAAPSKRNNVWVGKSDTQNRPQRVTVELNAQTGAILSRTNYADKQLLDRVIGYGIAIHEGQLFGWLNQLLGLFTALGLVTVSVSGIVMWWRRRQSNQLGAPIAQTKKNTRMPLAVLFTAVIFGVLLPFLGLSLLLVLMIEAWIMFRMPRASRFLGLQQ